MTSGNGYKKFYDVRFMCLWLMGAMNLWLPIALVANLRSNRKFKCNKFVFCASTAIAYSLMKFCDVIASAISQILKPNTAVLRARCVTPINC